MKKSLTLFLFFPILLFSQVFDDFSDGDFTQNPEWEGNKSKFIVNENYQLQLFDTVAATAILVTPNSKCLNTEWRFRVKMSFSPSGNNNARFYLISDQPDLSALLNGYFIQLGEAGSEDAIELFKQEGELITSICRGQDGFISSSFQFVLKITRDETGNWTIYVDPEGQGNYRIEAEGIDDEITSTGFLGVFCKYTVSNSTKFYFDDIYCGPIVVDLDPPYLTNLKATTDSSLQLTFNESMEIASASITTNYHVDKGIGYPIEAFADGSNPKLIHLFFDAKFNPGDNYILTVSSLKDLAGNVLVSDEMSFSYYLPQKFDLVINELMADPSPPVGLPEFEYLEIFNRTNKSVDLEGWALSIGSSIKPISDITIDAHEYLIVGHPDAEEELKKYGKFYGLSGFSLTNKGQQLNLLNADGDTISEVFYDDSWYRDSDKDDGGWSLEQINPDNFCLGSENWMASMSGSGGTPGEINSIQSSGKVLPALLNLEVVADNILRLTFNQMLDLSVSGKSENYIVDNGIGHPSMVFVYESKNELVELYFEEKFQKGIIYELIVDKALSNCQGSGMEKDTIIYFGIGEEAGYGDLVINEILFNPLNNGSDYVEIYNCSSKIIDVALLKIGTVKISPPNPNDTSYYQVSENQLLLMPGAYLLLTSSPEDVFDQYYTENPLAFYLLDPFPAYNNDNGICLIADGAYKLIDIMHYDEKMHHPMLIHTDGVALERIDDKISSSDPKNWHSAAQSVGFGTPGYRNSQNIISHDKEAPIVIEPEIFSPDNDGYNDVQGIKYTFDQPGYVLSADIFDAHGHHVKTLVNNQYLGTEGVIIWNGTREDNTIAPLGIYVYHIRLFDRFGNIQKYKKTGVLASRN